ncbi:hypothetical protein SAMN05444377_104179 [Flavobacterium fontis]|uniref:Outer membrane protein beta-barrel domain-containing protein n=1 Tax=Flavobacterium fontis TaxID=1124188 RepID=A0A1M4ZH08_9FLAO|nr:hypothetical protein [Flavobacterium fontis]SHF17238.1 hypothetical protein SAMN05444377_104179 [Flavobacterium fontis]
MKKGLVLLLLGLHQLITSQTTAGVEKNFYSIQTGIAGIWITNETRLSNAIALRSEIGLEHDFTVGQHYDNAGFILQPVLTVEPRLYYNLRKRNAQGRKTSFNSGDFLSIKTSYHPDWFVLNLDANFTKTADLSIVPTWGIKRQIGSNFTYETGLGFGYRIVYLKANRNQGSQYSNDGIQNRHQYVPYLHFRIGYVF